MKEKNEPKKHEKNLLSSNFFKSFELAQYISNLEHISYILLYHIIIYCLTYDSSIFTVCYFPIEFQGTFLIQSRNHEQQVGTFGGFSPRVMGPSSMSAALGHQTDSEITIESEGIPPWGSCHKRRGNNFILKDSSGPYDCMRCFHLTLKSPNVVQIHAEGEYIHFLSFMIHSLSPLLALILLSQR